uniref:Exostosin GT47 domain-containing protein n=1 Tax=Glycine max TaxID=3847 RepID=A0A368UHM5_SOYBN
MLPKSVPSAVPQPKTLASKITLTSSLTSLLQPQNPRTWILFTVLFIQILLLCNLHSFPSSIPPPLSPIPAATDTDTDTDTITTTVHHSTRTLDQCGSGKVFVYDLPQTFNNEILLHCDNLNPWSSRCDALSNDAFGRSAAALAGIVPEDLLPAWHWTDQFVTEIIFHNRLINHKCRVMEPESATAFYMPFYAGLAYEWFLPVEPESYSVFIDRNAVKNGTLTVKNVLEKFTKEEVRKMREKVIEYIPRLVYANTKQGLDGVEDAFDVAIEGVFKRIKEQEQPQFHKWK